MIGIEGRAAFVTGAASGIGAATARRLAAEGAVVAVADIDEAGAIAIADEIGGLPVVVDVTEDWSVRQGVEAAAKEIGPLEILVNNAGADRFARFLDTDEDSWNFVLSVNLRGVLACTHAALPAMYERRRGSIVNMASESGRLGTVGGATYSAAKAGVIGFTRAIARESARYGVRCNAVAPGPIDTPLLNNAAAALGEKGHAVIDAMIASTVLGRIGRPEEVAAAVAFLASDESSYITGHTLPVSGGATMW
jgi:2-hydroxycyclohexanecarboxyl-CoA dehydrogenase